MAFGPVRKVELSCPCGGTRFCRGLCRNCYARARRADVLPDRETAYLKKKIASFMLCVTKLPSGCWQWTGPITKDGYAQWNWKGKRVKAARASFELFKGPLGDLQACHKCDHRWCVSPDCLFAGTQKENEQDKMAKGRWNNQHTVKP